MGGAAEKVVELAVAAARGVLLPEGVQSGGSKVTGWHGCAGGEEVVDACAVGAACSGCGSEGGGEGRCESDEEAVDSWEGVVKECGLAIEEVDGCGEAVVQQAGDAAQVAQDAVISRVFVGVFVCFHSTNNCPPTTPCCVLGCCW